MAIIWGGFSNHMRVGLDIHADGYDTFTPSINVYVTVYAGVDSTWNFNDSQTVTLTGAAGGSWTFQNTMGANGVTQLGTVTIFNQSQNYGGGPTYGFTATLTGNYLGGTSSVGANFTLPARPIRPPGQPVSNPGFSSVTATSAFVAWGGTSDYGGANPDLDELQLALDPGFGNVPYDSVTGGSARTAFGLLPGATYWARARQHNAAGWGAWSGVTAFTTNTYRLPAPTLTDVGVTSVTVNWGDPPTSDAPSQYQLQVATDSGFTGLVGNFTAAWARSRAVTGLTPGTAYYYRVRASTGGGYGDWSPTAGGQTLSGAKVMRNGAWIDAPALVYSNGAWVFAKVYKRSGGAWVL